MTASGHSPHGRPRIGRAEVEASFNNQVRNMAVVRLIGRPIGNRLTPFFYNRGWTANQMTTLRLGLAVLAMVLLMALPPPYLWLVAVLYYLCFIGDCLDGNLARLGDDTSYWGKFYDGVADRFYYSAAPLAAGVGLWRDSGMDWLLIAGGVATAVFTYNDLISNRLQYFKLWMEGQSGPASYRTGKILSSFESLNDRVMTNGFFVAPLLLLLPGVGLNWYFWSLLLLQGLLGGLGLLGLVYMSYRTLSRRRKSKHAKGVDPEQAGGPGPDS
ncbi:MAG: CDP-alcohol phosphatidyltransferase family protein [Alphaproteobacteria bacterium]|nr:CDP-alcohol phosphatidyltransferase family protein [Alphaproteobacteria bacterium]